MSGHAFVAIALSDAERHHLAAALTSASPGSPVPGKRQPPQNWHVTLRFLGECTDATTDRMAHELSEVLDVPPGRTFASGLAAFPRPAKASVLYVALDDVSGLVSHLGGLCESVARDLGFDPEERPFVPHLTLSRLRPAQDLRRLIGSFDGFRVAIDVAAITMFRTRSSRSGVSYEPVHTIDLPHGMSSR